MTIDTESMLNLEADEVDVAIFLSERYGHLVRDDRLNGGGDRGVYWATMCPQSTLAEQYFVRVEWFAYPYEPPSIKFSTAVRGSLTVTSAWPLITGYRASTFDICRPLTREGYALHPEWKQGSTAWPTQGNPFLWVAQTVQFHFDNDYQGRAK